MGDRALGDLAIRARPGGRIWRFHRPVREMAPGERALLQASAAPRGEIFHRGGRDRHITRRPTSTRPTSTIRWAGSIWSRSWSTRSRASRAIPTRSGPPTCGSSCRACNGSIPARATRRSRSSGWPPPRTTSRPIRADSTPSSRASESPSGCRSGANTPKQSSSISRSRVILPMISPRSSTPPSATT